MRTKRSRQEQGSCVTSQPKDRGSTQWKRFWQVYWLVSDLKLRMERTGFKADWARQEKTWKKPERIMVNAKNNSRLLIESVGL